MESRPHHPRETLLAAHSSILNYPQFAAEELYGHIDNLELHVRILLTSYD